MKTGIISDAYLNRYGIEAGLSRLRAHGYEAMDYQGFIRTDSPLFSMSAGEFEQTLSHLKKNSDTAGIEIYQTHGHWRWPAMDFTKEQRAERFEKMTKAIRGCELLGCRHLVVHPLMPYGRYELDTGVACEINAAFYTQLAKVAREHGVVICMENMPFRWHHLSRPAEVLSFVKALGEPNIRMCLDTGHCTMFGISPADAAREIGRDYLRAVHVHDNDGTRDQHRLPGEGVIDWADFARSLQEIGFTGVFSLETCVEKLAPTPEEWENEEKKLAALATRLAGQRK